MEAAKSAVKDFLGKSGQHDTTVHEKVNPAVTHEQVTRTQHEVPTTAIDKEVHQHHYHTSVQPVTDNQRLPEQHHHKIVPVEHREFEHGNSEHDKTRLAAEAAKFKDQSTRVEGEHSHSVNPAVAGEHVHHHVHEHIQPVVQRQTIEPHVVHSTHPIHEVHHNAAQHHATSALPAVSLDEFQKHGGVLTGREERVDGFKGEPRTVGSSLEGAAHHGHHGHHGHHSNQGEHSTTTGATGTTGTTGTGLGSSTTGSTGANAGHDTRETVSGSSHPQAGIAGGAVPSTGAATTAGVGASGTGNTVGSHSASSETKPSLLDKLNPKKDADNDGKAGFMN